MKKDDELNYQCRWARIFSNNQSKVLEYWQKYRYFNTILDFCKLNEKSKVLDVGCGISTVLHFLEGHKFGIDPLADTYKTLYNYSSELNIITSNAEDIPFKDNYFDVIFCSNAFDHIDDIAKARDEIYRVLKPEGLHVLAVEVFQEKKLRESAHPNCLLKQDIYELIKIYNCLYERTIPWIGLREHIEGVTTWTENEMLFILKKDK